MTKRYLVVTFYLSATALAGCVTFHPKPILPDQTAARFEARSLNDPGLRHFVEQSLGRSFPTWPPPVWNLDLLTLTAFYYHPDLDIARAQWGVARAGRKTAGERPNPVFTFGPQNWVANSPADISPW